MKRLLFINLIIVLVCVSAWSQTITPGTGNTIYQGADAMSLGEPLTGLIGQTNALHITSGKIQGIADPSNRTNTVMAVNADGIRIYPVPADEVLYIDRDEETPANVRLLSPAGEVMLDTQIEGTKAEINTAPLAGGIYILTIGQNFSIKIIKR